MNKVEFQYELNRQGLNVEKVAGLIGMPTTSLYKRIAGKVAFKQNEIVSISKVLHLSGERILEIFFSGQVS